MKNIPANIHEEHLINTFIDKGQQQRIKALLKNKKGRVKLRQMLSHSIRFNKSMIKHIPDNIQTGEEILKIFNRHRIDNLCYLISEHASFDGHMMTVNDAVNNIVGNGISTIISCIPGKLAYYEGEGFNNRFFLESI